MKKATKKIGIFVLLCVFLMGIGCSARTLFFAESGRSGAYVFVRAYMTPGYPAPNNDYGLVKGWRVKKVTINLREGSYNKTKSTSDTKEIKLQKVNNPSETAYGTWKWTYY